MRIKVWGSRLGTLGASSFVTLTRVCNAIRSALELKFGIAPPRNSIIPDFRGGQSKLVPTAKSSGRNFEAKLASNRLPKKSPTCHSERSKESAFCQNAGKADFSGRNRPRNDKSAVFQQLPIRKSKKPLRA